MLTANDRPQSYLRDHDLSDDWHLWEEALRVYLDASVTCKPKGLTGWYGDPFEWENGIIDALDWWQYWDRLSVATDVPRAIARPKRKYKASFYESRKRAGEAGTRARGLA